MKFILIYLFLFINMTINASAGFFEPSNFEECILENMKGVTSDQAAHAIRNACREKFPLEEKPVRHASDFQGYPFEEETYGHQLINYYILNYHKIQYRYNPESFIAGVFKAKQEKNKDLIYSKWAKEYNIEFFLKKGHEFEDFMIGK